ncbi:VOC family protein [Mycolicibacterium sp. S2-37]|uniref:VOC family protein n=1 Tax=Mycolicibacterium sp. S2-37 TaxID=2810297 RepID=UPI001A948407|nr:VOC family protein [Mycolicibacterium sp. S2-37]MBO0680258.1 VOC family protein [Mycolicibacterium sp. S2-37]
MALEIQPLIAPHLTVGDAAAAIDFYVRAFGATEQIRLPGPDGRLIHAAVEINGSMVMLMDDFPEYNDGKASTPTALGGSSVTIHLQVTDVDTLFQQAVDAGAEVLMPLSEQFWGDRYGCVRDPFGHLWSMGQPVREVNMEELQASMGSQ